MKKILISDSVDENCTAILKSTGFEVDYKTDLSKEDLLEIISDYNALIVRSSTQVNADLIEKMNSMEVIGRAGAGVDNIDVKAATRKGILVMNTPGGNTISAAEHTIALMLAASRKIPQANISLHLKKWDRKRFQGSELFGKTLYGGMSLVGVAFDTQTLKDADVPKIRQIEVRENISTISPKIIGVVQIGGKNSAVYGRSFPGRDPVEEMVENSWNGAKESGGGSSGE